MMHPGIADVTTNIAEYLKTPNAGCVGGSWLTPAKAAELADPTMRKSESQ
jgi:2-keto-3-deoxy-6-phosphogluconate aldolase